MFHVEQKGVKKRLMGGTIAVTLRQKDKSLIKMARWTNIFPDVLATREAIENRDSYFDSFIEKWLEMRRDYIKHREDRKFEFGMTTRYATDENMVCVPQNYGLIFIDRLAQEIHHMQGYIGMNSQTICAYNKRDKESIFPWLAENDRLSYRLTGAKVTPLRQITSLKHLNEVREDGAFYMIQICFNPWKVIDYTEDKWGAEKFRSYLMGSGVKFTNEELMGWEEWIKERE